MTEVARPRRGAALTSKIGETRWATLLVLGAACALVLPGLGASGLWHPAETEVAGAAAALAAGRDRPSALALPSSAWLPALGLRLLPAGEIAARLPGALIALASLLAAFAAGRVWFGRRAAWLAVAALAGLPLYTLSARQLPSDGLLGLGVLAAITGFGIYLKSEWQSIAGIGVFVLGLGIAWVGGGALVGVVPLLLAAAAAIGVGAAKPLHRRARLVLILALVGAAGLAAAMLAGTRAGSFSWLLGGRPPVAPAPAPTFDVLIETLGFGLFPLGVLGFFALYLLTGADARGQQGALVLLFTAGLGLAASTLQLHLLGQARLLVVPVVAVALGAWLDERIKAASPQPLLAFIACVGALLLMRDLLLAPEALLSTHLPARISWPAAVSIAPIVRAVGALVALGIALFVGLPDRWVAGARFRHGRAVGLALLLGAPIGGSFALGHHVVPALGPHLSQRDLGARFAALAPPGTPLGLYHIDPGELGPFHTPPTRALAGPSDVIGHFGPQAPAFALIARSDLPALDAALGQARTSYLVIDDASSRALLLGAGLPAAIADLNPLAHIRWRPGSALPPPIAPDAPALGSFGPAIELVAVNFPKSARRGGNVAIKLTFRITATGPHDHKIFVHLERGGTLLHGDHPPVRGLFPSQHWRAGDLITDESSLELPALSAAGRYQLSVGFWPGGDTLVRLPLTVTAAGSSAGIVNDGRDRAVLGHIDVD